MAKEKLYFNKLKKSFSFFNKHGFCTWQIYLENIKNFFFFLIDMRWAILITKIEQTWTMRIKLKCEKSRHENIKDEEWKGNARIQDEEQSGRFRTTSIRPKKESREG